MFVLGLFIMCISVAGLIGLAFLQARYPDALESIMLPIDAEPKDESAAMEPAAAAAQPATPAAPAEEVEDINVEDIPVNSVSMRDMTSARQIK